MRFRRLPLSLAAHRTQGSFFPGLRRIVASRRERHTTAPAHPGTAHPRHAASLPAVLANLQASQIKTERATPSADRLSPGPAASALPSHAAPIPIVHPALKAATPWPPGERPSQRWAHRGAAAVYSSCAGTNRPTTMRRVVSASAAAPAGTAGDGCPCCVGLRAVLRAHAAAELRRGSGGSHPTTAANSAASSGGSGMASRLARPRQGSPARQLVYVPRWVGRDACMHGCGDACMHVQR
eukprot:361382-Chlamydomonas_euryale.AAC.3